MAIRSKKLGTCGLLLRLTPKVVDGQKIPAVDVLNLHLD